MAQVALYLLGLPRLERDGVPVTIDRRRTFAVAIYLALTGRAHSRDALAAFFWPEHDARSARTDLRRTLHGLNRALGAEWLLVEEERVAFRQDPNLWVDVLAFRRLLAACGEHGHRADALCPRCLPLLQQAVALYRDDFLAGFSLGDSPAFDDWQFFEGETLRDELTAALDRLTDGYTRQGAYAQATATARRRLAIDPLAEAAHRQLMQLYAWQGQPGSALRQYEQCVQTLAAELDVPPDAETQALAAQIKTRQVAAPPRDPQFVEQTPTAPPSVPSTPPVADEVRLVTALSIGLTAAATAGPEPNNARLTALAADAQRLRAVVEAAGQPYTAQVTALPGADLLVLFGAHQVHEDDAERAVRMAVAIQAAAQAQDLSVQMGMSSGSAYCQPAPTGQSAVTVLGPLVRQATRLRHQAGVNQILLDQGAYQLTRGLCAYQTLTLTLPGAATPVSVYQVRHLRSRAIKARGIEGLHAALVGRTEELSKLCAALTKAQGGDGQLVALVGAAGVGKSRLVEELKEDFRFWILDFRLADGDPKSKIQNLKSKILWLEGRALPFASASSYWVFADLLRGFWNTAEADKEAQVAANLRNTLAQLRDQGYLQATDVEEIGPLLGQLLAVRFGDAWDTRLAQVDPQQLRQRTLLALPKLLGALARRQPTVLVLEDLQWVDALSLDLITALLPMLATTPLLLLCVYRPEAAQADGQLAAIARHHCPERFTELPLLELTPAESRQLVAALLAIEALPATMRTAILDKAQGNPLFLEELVRALIDSGQLYRQGDTWQAHVDLPTFTVPETLQGLVLSRCDQLPATARHFLQLAAVLGRLFQPTLVERMAAAPLDSAATLRPLIEKNFIYQERAFPAPEYSFHHVLVRDAIYQALPASRRQGYHRRAGEALEQHYADNLAPYIEALAYHYDQADVADKAIGYLLQAGEKARRAYLNQEAAAAFKRALTRLDLLPFTAQTQGWRLAALTGLGRLYQVMSEFAAAEGYLREAITLSQQVKIPVAELVRLYYWLGDLILNWQPRPQEALQLAQAGLALLGDDLTSAEAGMMDAVRAWGYYLLGDMPQFYAIGFRLATFLAEAPYAQELRPAYGVVSTTYLENKEITTALHWIDHARQKAAQYQDLHWLAESAYPFTRVFAGRPLAEIMAGQTESLRLFQIAGDRKRLNWNDLETGYISLLYGALTQAQTALERAVPEVYAINQENLPSLWRLLGEVYHAQGRWTEALAAFQQALTHYQQADVHPAEVLVALAYTQLHAGQPRVAIDYFTEALTAMATPAFVIPVGHYPTATRALFVNALCGLEEALADADAFHAFCANFRAARPALAASKLTQWHLEPAQPPAPMDDNSSTTTFATGLTAPWQWRDPVGNASVNTTAGLLIATPNPRELWDAFLTAPCLLQPIDGDWVVQVLCRRPWADRPAIGGLLLWQDKWHFLRLDWGTRGQAEVALQGCVARREIVIGRGRLPGDAIYLRLERTGDHLRGFCSSDGATWFSVGEADFVVTAPVQLGLFTASYIERLIDPGAYPDGTAIHFTNYQFHGKQKDRSTDDPSTCQ